MAVLMNFIQSAVFFICFLGIAWAGVVVGRWYRDKKSASKQSGEHK